MEPKFESRLREARTAKGMSQEELARRAGVSRETIRNIENGLSVPNVLLALVIGGIVGWGISELFKPKKGGTDHESGN
ncbi:MAG: helix-turn-helix domain-containing protein [Alicyclobacillus macrosporangiidus]|uniref:helix-turn-helix transcriptional regulator n=1 Tax=Alicyclobacillus macrosporangiidus TaxID=392015 RepID=UPI0034E96571|nr:helix-turn-helix domain-containing protein [Alicyclobacillus macrosporangiidus]